MMRPFVRNRLRAASFGLTLCVFAIVTWLAAQRIVTIGLGHNHDPGARAFPIWIAIALLVGGILEIWNAFTKPSLAEDPETAPANADAAGPTLASAKKAGGLVASFVIYIVAIPWLGFSLSTLTMATLMMIILGTSWKMAVIVSLVLVVVVNLLFVTLFKVPLPDGVLGLPF